MIAKDYINYSEVCHMQENMLHVNQGPSSALLKM